LISNENFVAKDLLRLVMGLLLSLRPVEPQIDAESFSCPHCGAFAHQCGAGCSCAFLEKGKTLFRGRYEQLNLKAAEDIEDQNEPINGRRASGDGG
jgi:hypothetical protein